MAFGPTLVILLVIVAVAVRLRVVSNRLRRSEEQVHRLDQEKEMVVRFMREMVGALEEGVERGELLQRIVRAALRCTGAVSACYYEALPDGRVRGVAVEGLFPPQRPIPEASRGKIATRAKYIEQILHSETLDPGEGVIGSVAKKRQGELVVDARSDSRLVDHGDVVLAMRSMIATPIEFRGSLIGVLAVANPISGGAFTETDFTLVQSLAEQAGLAVHNNEFVSLQLEKRQMDLDLSIAQEIQQLLVPQQLPKVDGLDIDARYIPAKKVGGDLLDAIELPDGRLAVIVADVAGKSVGASILMAICRTHLRHALGRTASPAELMREVNRSMVGEFRPEMFVTALLALIEPQSGKITLARAGHEAPLVVRRGSGEGSARCEFPQLEGVALGLGEPELFDESIEDSTVTLGKDDVLVLYTDGVTEAANPDGKEFSGARLADALRVLCDRDAAGICEGTLEHVRRFTGATRQNDDLSFIVVKRTG